jgi:uronate dehydrogenase
MMRGLDPDHVSNNDRGPYDTTSWEQMGYRPEDDSDDFAQKVPPGDEPELERLFHGAHFITPGFSGDIDRNT